MEPLTTQRSRSAGRPLRAICSPASSASSTTGPSSSSCFDGRVCFIKSVRRSCLDAAHCAVVALLVALAISGFAVSHARVLRRLHIVGVAGIAWLLGALVIAEAVIGHVDRILPAIALRGGILLDRFQLGQAATATVASAALALIAAGLHLRAEGISPLYIVAPPLLLCVR